MSRERADCHILIALSRYYSDIADQLLSGATGELQSANATWEVLEVPGAFELPAVLRFASLSGAFDGYMALGCVIRGETSHFDYICAESARALSDLAIRLQLAVGHGILTTDTSVFPSINDSLKATELALAAQKSLIENRPICIGE